MNPVHEHCSSQKNFKFFFIKLNKNQIKLDKKILEKIKFSKNEIFVDENILNAKLIVLHYL